MLDSEEKNFIQSQIEFIIKIKMKGQIVMIFHLGELFCGPGGIALGAPHADIRNEDFGIVHQWAINFDESTCRTYTRLYILD